jgi:hypothetical protein
MLNMNQIYLKLSDFESDITPFLNVILAPLPARVCQNLMSMYLLPKDNTPLSHVAPCSSGNTKLRHVSIHVHRIQHAGSQNNVFPILKVKCNFNFIAHSQISLETNKHNMQSAWSEFHFLARREQDG